MEGGVLPGGGGGGKKLNKKCVRSLPESSFAALNKSRLCFLVAKCLGWGWSQREEGRVTFFHNHLVTQEPRLKIHPSKLCGLLHQLLLS